MGDGKDYKDEKAYIKKVQNGILLSEYTLTDMLWFMKHYKDSVLEKISKNK